MGGARGRLLSLVAIVGLVACTKVSTNPSVVTALELHDPQLPALVESDTLRDTTGTPAPLVAVAFNGANDTIADAPLRFLALDTGIVTVDSVTGVVTGRDTTGEARIIASAGTLQSLPVTVRVTLPPDSLQPLGSLSDTVHVVLGTDSSVTLQVRVSHDTTPAVPGDSLVPVPNYLVHFAIVDPPNFPTRDTTTILLVDDRRAPSGADTTDAQGSASRRLLVPRSLAATPPDSIVVEASAVRQNRERTPVPGSPIRFVIHIQLASTSQQSRVVSRESRDRLPEIGAFSDPRSSTATRD